MKDNLDVEYCRPCDSIYATNANIWLLFRNYEGETRHSQNDLTVCPRCYHPILRYVGYLDALKLREEESFINEVIYSINDLSDSSLITLRELLMQFTVPSFSVILDGVAFHLVDELIKKRYVSAETDGERTVVTLNAYKLGLFDNKTLLLEMVYQRSFITNPEHIEVDNSYGRRRKARLDAMVDDFSKKDKDDLLRKFKGKCALTGKDVPLHLDHVIPVAVGYGGTSKTNMLPVWQRINSSKSDRNIFEWYEESGKRFEVLPELFDKAIEYLSDLNGMTVQEYRDYVDDCHANPIDILTEEIT